jgi:hypothetical protein
MSSLNRVAALALATAVIATTSPVVGAKSGSRTTVDDFGACFLQRVDPLSVRDGELPTDGAVKVTFLGTSTLLFDDGTTQLMIDGFLTRPAKCAVLGGEIQTSRPIVEAALRQAGVEGERLRAVFVSHSHYDHALDVADIVSRYAATTLYGSRSTMMIGAGGEQRGGLYQVMRQIDRHCLESPRERALFAALVKKMRKREKHRTRDEDFWTDMSLFKCFCAWFLALSLPSFQRLQRVIHERVRQSRSYFSDDVVEGWCLGTGGYYEGQR